MSSKQIKYADIIFPDEKKVEKERKEEAVEDAKIELVNAIGAAKKVVRQCSKSLQSSLRAIPFRPENILQFRLDLEDAESNLEALEDLNSLF